MKIDRNTAIMMQQKKMNVVKSGIGLDVSIADRAADRSQQAPILTSRSARVLLAGAGFLADAVRFLFTSTPSA
jgi:hypothetical protein